MTKKLQFSFLICSLLILFCSAVSAQKFGKVEDSEWQVSAPADYPEAGAVIIFDKQKVKVSIQNIIIERHVRIKVLTSNGGEEVGDRSIYYNEKYGNLKDLEAQTITPDGKKHKVEKDAFFEKSHNHYITKSFSFPNVEQGAILEYRYKYKYDYHNIPNWYFQNDLYTMLSEITVSLAPGFAFDMLYKNVPSIYKKPIIDTELDPASNGYRKLKNYTWKLENLPPIKDEPFMSSPNDYMASLRFMLISYTYPNGSVYPIVKDWLDQADNNEKWFDEYCNKDGEIKKLAEEITNGLTDNLEKSKAIFEYIKTNFKSSDDYISWYFAHDKISDLFKEKTGTPEEKNLLLVQLHKAVGIDCWPVLISLRSNGKFDPSYPDDAQFNYLIAFVQIGDAWEFLDVADRNALYGILQPQCLTDGGLLLDGDNSQLVKMTIKPFNSSRIDTTTMFIDSEGLASCSTSSVMTGYYASEQLNDFDNSTQEEFIDDFIKKRVEKAIDLGTYTCTPNENNNFEVRGSFTSNELVRQLDENLIVKPVSFAYVKNPFKSEKRFFAIDFTYPFTYQNTVNINFEKTPKEIHLPKDVLIDLGNIRLTRTSKLEGTTVVLTHVLEVLVPELHKAKYNSVKDLFEQLSLLDDDEVSLVYEEN